MKDYETLDEKMKERINKLCELLSCVPVPFREYDIRKIGGRDGSLGYASGNSGFCIMLMKCLIKSISLR